MGLEPSNTSATLVCYWTETGYGLCMLYGVRGNSSSLPSMGQSRLASDAVPFPLLSRIHLILTLKPLMAQSKQLKFTTVNSNYPEDRGVPRCGKPKWNLAQK